MFETNSIPAQKASLSVVKLMSIRNLAIEILPVLPIGLASRSMSGPVQSRVLGTSVVHNLDI